jgi:chromate reductase
VALLNAAPRATHAYLALRETVTMMSANVIEAACITLPIPLTNLTEENIVQHSSLSAVLSAMLEELQSYGNN